MLRRSVGIASLAGRALKTTNVVRTNFVEYNVILKRSMGGGAMPYNEPGGNLFNEVVSKSKPNRHRTWESWEYGYWSTCIAGVIFGTVGLSTREDTSIKTWATKEAIARNNAGVTNDANLGEAYTLTHGFKVNGIGQIPIRGGGEDDEEDE